jgi:hypothetical protein
MCKRMQRSPQYLPLARPRTTARLTHETSAAHLSRAAKCLAIISFAVAWQAVQPDTPKREKKGSNGTARMANGVSETDPFAKRGVTDKSQC